MSLFTQGLTNDSGDFRRDFAREKLEFGWVVVVPPFGLCNICRFVPVIEGVHRPF